MAAGAGRAGSSIRYNTCTQAAQNRESTHISDHPFQSNFKKSYIEETYLIHAHGYSGDFVAAVSEGGEVEHVPVVGVGGRFLPDENVLGLG